jgi:hypothetical protein
MPKRKHLTSEILDLLCFAHTAHFISAKLNEHAQLTS